MKQYPKYNYQTLTAENRSKESLIKEYSRLRKIANQRISSLLENDLRGYSYEIDAFIKKGFKPVTSKTRPQRIRQSLVSVSRFLNNPFSTTRQMKSKIKADLKIFRDYFENAEALNEANLREFYDFLEEFRTATKGQYYSSKFEVTVWEQAERIGISKKSLIADLGFWSTHIKDMEKIERKENKRKISSYTAKRMLEKAVRESGKPKSNRKRR